MPFPRRASDGNATARPPVFTLRLRRQGIASLFLSLLGFKFQVQRLI